MLIKLRHILGFYFSVMFLTCLVADVGFAWIVAGEGSSAILWCFLSKVALYKVYLYVWITPRYAYTLLYYRNLGVRQLQLLGVCLAIDLIICFIVLELAAFLFYVH